METEQSIFKPARLLLVLLLVMLGAAIVFSNAARSAALAANLNGSSKTSSTSTVAVDGTVKYTLVVSNSGDTNASNVLVTDTLPAGVTYVNSTYSAQSSNNVLTNSHSATANQVLWSGTVGSGRQIAISFDVSVSAPITAGNRITNNLLINYDGATITRTVVITASAEPPTKTYYLPITMRSLVEPTLQVSDPTGNEQWTTSWNAIDGATGYTLQESRSADFSTILNQGDVTALSVALLRVPSANNVYYYRVRAFAPGATSNWSNVVKVVGTYYDDFSGGTGEWTTRRQDQDDVTNEIHHVDGSYLKMWVRGRWDYMLSSPLHEAPPPPYRIETRVKFEGVGNLNTYGMIWGGDWNGLPCPAAGRSTTIPETMIAPTSDIVYSNITGRAPQNFNDNCFQTYYRTIMLWQGPGNEMKFQWKRVEYHDDNNHGKGTDLMAWQNIQLQSGDSLGWNDWAVEVYADGTMKLFSGTNLVATVQDTSYINQPYFGFFASTDEYPGSDPLWDYIRITRITP